MANYQTVETREYVDMETGEVKSIEMSKRFSYKIQEDDFFMIFYKYVQANLELKSFLAFKMLIALGKRADWETGKVVVSTAERELIMSEIHGCSKNFSRIMGELVRSGAVAGSRGNYFINPKYFWKGSLKKRRELIDKGYEFYAEFGFKKPQNDSL